MSEKSHSKRLGDSQLASIHQAQLFTYLKRSHKPLGLLINFNTRLMKDGIIRVRGFTRLVRRGPR